MGPGMEAERCTAVKTGRDGLEVDVRWMDVSRGRDLWPWTWTWAWAWPPESATARSLSLPRRDQPPPERTKEERRLTAWGGRGFGWASHVTPKQSVPFRCGVIGTARWLVPSTVRSTVRHGTAQERWQSGHGSGAYLPTSLPAMIVAKSRSGHTWNTWYYIGQPILPYVV